MGLLRSEAGDNVVGMSIKTFSFLVESNWRWIVVPLGGIVISTATNRLWFGSTDAGDGVFGLINGLVVLGTVELKQRSMGVGE